MRILAACAALALTSCAGFVRAPEPSFSPETGKADTADVRMVDLNPATLQQLNSVDTASIPTSLLIGRRDNYRIGPLDVIVVTVWEHPELTTPLGMFRTDLAAGQLVDADGTMFFPYAGRIKVAGLTLPELQKQLTTTLARVLRDPQVDAKLVGYRSKRVFLAGEVKIPGVYPVDDVPLSLPELLHRAGGITALGDGSSIELLRAGRIHYIDYAGLQRRGISLDSLVLLPGDQVRVPSSEERKAYLLGEVARPSAVRLPNGSVSLVQALAEVGGFNVLTANTGKVYLMRSEAGRRMTVYRLDASNMLALAWADQFRLRPRDLVFVDQSGAAKWNRIVAQMLPTAQLLNNVTGAASNVTNTTVNIDNLREE